MFCRHLNKCVFCFCCTEYSINVSWGKLVVNVIQVFNILADFLPALSSSYWEVDIESSNYNYGFIHFSLSFFLYLLCVIWSPIFRAIKIENRYVLLFNWPSHHSEMTPFSLGNIFCFEIYFVWCCFSTLALFWQSVLWDMFRHPLRFTYLNLHMKCNFCRWYMLKLVFFFKSGLSWAFNWYAKTICI